MFDAIEFLSQRGYDPDAARDFLDSRESLDRFREPVRCEAMAAAVERLKFAASHGEVVGIYGDYDCDGVTSAAILTRYLSKGLGIDVRPRLPDRFRDGYGLHPQAVNQLADRGCQVLVTCDNGISAHAGVDRCIIRGVDCIVTDHHRVPNELPEALALVHPGVAFPAFKDLCGAGVAWLLCIALEGGLSTRLESFLDMVALGTVADMVPLDGPNRPLVWHGLKRMRRGLVYPGVNALLAQCYTKDRDLSARDLAFSVCPKLNAAGRLETPDVGLELMLTNDMSKAQALAMELDRLNRERRALAKEHDLVAMGLADDQVRFIVMADPGFHAGLIGLSAARLVEKYQRPALVFAPTEDGYWRGSGRSPAGCDLFMALEACSEHLIAFGGHAAAAGCRVKDTDAIGQLTRDLNAHLLDWQPKGPPRPDAVLAPGRMDHHLLRELDRLEPTGQRNEAPLFGWTAVSEKIEQRNNHLFVTCDGVRIPFWNTKRNGLKKDAELELVFRVDGGRPIGVSLKEAENPVPVRK